MTTRELRECTSRDASGMQIHPPQWVVTDPEAQGPAQCEDCAAIAAAERAAREEITRRWLDAAQEGPVPLLVTIAPARRISADMPPRPSQEHRLYRVSFGDFHQPPGWVPAPTVVWLPVDADLGDALRSALAATGWHPVAEVTTRLRGTVAAVWAEVQP